MLVLTRKLGERIVIARDIVVTVVGFTRTAIRLGIDAPRDVRVLRQELIEPGEARRQAVADRST